MGRIARSWELTRQSYRVLMQDKELLLLPLLSSTIILLVCGSFVFGLGLQEDQILQSGEVGAILPLLLFYVVSYTIGFFFQAALIAGACQRLAGGDPTLGSALGAAWRRFGAILAWGLVAGTVGLVLRMIQERSELLGKLVAGLLGVVWSLATFFMVPVLVMEEQPLGEAFKRSAALFKKTWGESVAGNFGIGLIGFLVMLPLCLLGMAVGSAVSPLAGILVAVPMVALAAVFFAALQGVFLASVYRFATRGEAPRGFDVDLLATVFKPKEKRRR